MVPAEHRQRGRGHLEPPGPGERRRGETARPEGGQRPRPGHHAADRLCSADLPPVQGDRDLGPRAGRGGLVAGARQPGHRGVVRACAAGRAMGRGSPCAPHHATTRHVSLSVVTDRTMVVAVRAIDDHGNASDWVESPPLVPRFIDESDPAVRASSDWRSRASSDSLGGRVLSSTTARRTHHPGVPGARRSRSSRRGREVGHRSRCASTTRGRPSSISVRRTAGPASRCWPDAGQAMPHIITCGSSSAPPSTPRVDIDGFLILETPTTP